MTERGGQDLGNLLAELSPALSLERYAFEISDHPIFEDGTFALIREDEGVTAIRADDAGRWARISLGLQSSLDAVGLTAALSAALAKAGISANIVAALHHDHLFVPWERRHEALKVLQALA